MTDNLTPAALCRQNGWEAGDILQGDEGDGPQRILLTAIGESAILVVFFKIGLEGSMLHLVTRDWKKVAKRCPDCYLAPEDFAEVGDMMNHCGACDNTGILEL